MLQTEAKYGEEIMKEHKQNRTEREEQILNTVKGHEE